MLRRIGRLLFWSMTAAAALVVLLFLRAAVPVWLAITEGGLGHFWFFGPFRFVLMAAIACLAAAVAVAIRQRTRGDNRASTRRDRA